MKYKRLVEGLEQRRRAYDALPTKDKQACQRPGSLSSSGSGPRRGRRKR